MGTDKALLQTASTTWAASALEKIGELGIPAVLSVNTAQHSSYAERFPSIPLITDAEGISIKGPLAGVLSAHQQYPHQDLLVLACDMPLMETALLQYLVATPQTNPGFDAYAFQHSNEWEPLCSIYTAKGLSTILQQFQSGALPKYSMKYVLEQLTTFALPVTAEQAVYFTNFNTPDELERR